MQTKVARACERKQTEFRDTLMFSIERIKFRISIQIFAM